MMGDPEGTVASKENSAAFEGKSKKEGLSQEPKSAKKSQSTEKGHDQPKQTVSKEEGKKDLTSTSFNLVTFDRSNESKEESRMSQITVFSVAISIISWMTSQFQSFMRVCNGTYFIPRDVVHILKVIGIDSNKELKSIARSLHLKNVQDIALLTRGEWIEACGDADINPRRTERLWIGVQSFVHYYRNQVSHSNIDSAMFSPASYNRILHSRNLDSEFARSRPTPPNLVNQIGLDTMDTISPMQSNDEGAAKSATSENEPKITVEEAKQSTSTDLTITPADELLLSTSAQGLSASVLEAARQDISVEDASISQLSFKPNANSDAITLLEQKDSTEEDSQFVTAVSLETVSSAGETTVTPKAAPSSTPAAVPLETVHEVSSPQLGAPSSTLAGHTATLSEVERALLEPLKSKSTSSVTGPRGESEDQVDSQKEKMQRYLDLSRQIAQFPGITTTKHLNILRLLDSSYESSPPVSSVRDSQQNTTEVHSTLSNVQGNSTAETIPESQEPSAEQDDNGHGERVITKLADITINPDGSVTAESVEMKDENADQPQVEQQASVPRQVTTPSKKKSWAEIEDESDNSSVSSASNASTSSSSSSSTSSSDSDESSDSSDDEAIGTFKLSDIQNMKLLQLPCSKKDFEVFIRQIMNRLSLTGADKLITMDKSKRVGMPEKPKGINGKQASKKKMKKFKKKRKLYNKRNRIVMLFLNEMANNAKHYLAKDLQKFSCGVKAFDFLVERMNPMSVDPTNENATALERFQKLELISVAKGAFSKFFSLFEHLMADVTSSEGVTFTDKYKKSVLLSKLKHPAYAPMHLPAATSKPYPEFVKDMYQFSVIIEKDSKSSYKKALLNNATTSDDKGSGGSKSKVIDQIMGLKIDGRGMVSKKDFQSLSDEKRDAFLKKRREYNEDSQVSFKKHSKFQGDDGNSKGKDLQKLKKKINNLKKELKDSKGDSEESVNRTTLINNVKSLNMPESQQKKIIAYMEKHVKTMRTVHFSEEVIRRANMLETSDDRAPTIIDGGADTGMNGSAYIFLEHTGRKANVTGYDSEMVRSGMPIGTSVTAAKDVHGDTIILLQNEQIDHSSQPNSMLAPNQVRHYGIDLDDRPECYDVDGQPGRQSMKAGDHEIPFSYEKGLVYLYTWRPSDEELRTCPVIMLTSDSEWNPDSLDGNPALHPSPTPWSPDSTSNQRTVVDANARNILRMRVEDNNDVHVLHSSRPERAAPQSKLATEYDSEGDRIPDLVPRSYDDDSSDEGSISDEDSVASSDLESLPDLVERDTGSISDEEDDHCSISDQSTDISLISVESSISSIFNESHSLSAHSGGDEPETEKEDKGKSVSFSGNVSTREQLDGETRDSLELLSQATNHEVLQYIESLDREHKRARVNATSTNFVGLDWETMRKRLAYLPMEIIKKTFEVTTQLAKMDVRLPLRRHFKSRFPQANVNRLREVFATDTFFASTRGINGETMVQLFSGIKSQLVVPYGMSQESEGPTKLQEFIKDWGAPDGILRDNSKMQNSEAWKKIERLYQVKSSQSEPHNQQQNPAERKIQTVKNGVGRLMDRTGTPKFMWYECLVYFCNILNITACEPLGYRTPTEVALGHSVDISPYIAYEWWEPVYYLAYEDPSFPESKEKLGRFCGPVSNCGDLMTFKIYVKETHQILHRSVLRSAKEDRGNPNLRAANPNYSGEDGNSNTPDDFDLEEELRHSGEDGFTDNSDIPNGDELTSLSEVLEAVGGDPLGNVEVIAPQDMLGFTFPMEHDGITQRATVKSLGEVDEPATIELMDGSRQLIEYNLLLEKFNTPEEDGNQVFTFSKISGHRKRRQKWEVKVEWDGHGFAPTWEPLSTMRKADPITLAMYARDQNLVNTNGWKWARNIKVDGTKMIRTAKRISKVKKKFGQIKYKFGVQVPRDAEEALKLDEQNGDKLWREAIDTELGQILEYETFKVLERGEEAPDDHTFVTLTLIFDVKHDGRRKARLVAGGHLTDPSTEEVYSSVVGPEGIRAVTYIAEANGLKLMCGDVGNAYLNGRTREKIWVRFGPEFGKDLAGKVGIMYKGLYGLKSSGARWSEHFADTLREMKWVKSKAENDIWMQDSDEGYDYLAVYSDDVLVASKNPSAILDQLKTVYTLKGVGVPDYYLGAEYGRVNGEYTASGSTSTWSAKTFLRNVIDKIERIFGKLRSYTVPMDPEYYPEVDESTLLRGEDISKYRMLTGSAQWAITLGRIDIIYATTMLSRYNNAPREGHLNAMKKLFGYLKGHSKGRIVYDTRPLDIPNVKFMDPVDWTQTYGTNVQESIPPDMPEPKMKKVTITVYFDASFGSDMLTRRSVTGIILFFNSTPVKWFCKKQNTVETSTYGSELVAGRLACEMVIEYRYKLRMLGIPVEEAAIMLGDNMSVIQNCSLPSSQLKKKHNAIAYHRIRECVAAKIISLGHVSSEDNFADLCTKALNGPKLHGLMRKLDRLYSGE